MRRKGIKNLIILYDPDALDDIKKYLWGYENMFNIFGARLNGGDPDDVSQKELIRAIKDRRKPLNFKNSFLNKL